MKRLLCCTVLMALVSLAGAQSLEAQSRKGLGGILDYISRLSGPRMVGPAVTGWVALGEVPALRMTVARRWSVHYADAVLPENESVRMWSFRPTLEVRLPRGPFAVGSGVAIHRFDGNFESFTNVSVPVYAQARFPNEGRVRAVLQAGLHFWQPFDEGDFAPLETGVNTENGELTEWFGVGFEIVWD